MTVVRSNGLGLPACSGSLVMGDIRGDLVNDVFLSFQLVYPDSGLLSFFQDSIDESDNELLFQKSWEFQSGERLILVTALIPTV